MRATYFKIIVIIIALASCDSNVKNNNANEVGSDSLYGIYIGREQCSLDHTKNKWSNSYKILVTDLGNNKISIENLYFQYGNVIKGEINGTKFSFDERNGNKTGMTFSAS